MSETRYLISETARITQVEPHVLRYWEEELGLAIGRNEMGHRYYTDKDIQTFLNIKELKNKGLQLRAIREAIHQAEGQAPNEARVIKFEPKSFPKNTERYPGSENSKKSLEEGPPGAAEKDSKKDLENSSEKNSGRNPEEDSPKAVERSSKKNSEADSSKAAERSSKKDSEAGLSKTTERNPKKNFEAGSLEAAERSLKKNSEAGSSKPAERSSKKNSEAGSSKAVERSSKKNSEAGSSKPAGKDSEKNLERDSGTNSEKDSKKDYGKNSEDIPAETARERAEKTRQAEQEEPEESNPPTESKAQRFETIMERLIREIERDERKEGRYRRLDEAIRRHQQSRRLVAATEESGKRKKGKRFGKKTDRLSKKG